MSYCRKYNKLTGLCDCLACKDCRPPGERIDGRMCKFEFRGDIQLKYSTEQIIEGLYFKIIFDDVFFVTNKIPLKDYERDLLYRARSLCLELRRKHDDYIDGEIFMNLPHTGSDPL